jgi:hypothetical protein
MAIGAFGPWQEVLVFSVSGLDGDNDGGIVVAAAAFGAAGAWWAAARQPLVGGAVAAVCGATAAVVALVDRGNEPPLDFGPFDLAEVGWGLDVATLGSFSLLLAGLTFVWRGLAGRSRARRSSGAGELPPAPDRPALERGAIPMPPAPARPLPPAGDDRLEA